MAEIAAVQGFLIPSERGNAYGSGTFGAGHLIQGAPTATMTVASIRIPVRTAELPQALRHS